MYWCESSESGAPSIFSMWSPMSMRPTRSTRLPGRMRLTNASPVPLSVMVSPSASSLLTSSTSLRWPRTCANTKSSSASCPPSSFSMSILCVFSVQNRICTRPVRHHHYCIITRYCICRSRCRNYSSCRTNYSS